ncbi:MAG: hypothetical protein E7655_04900 [Ruminococcaceae bacterium]|nr:hypothetical protein [Oscillospiraceae bacterium]
MNCQKTSAVAEYLRYNLIRTEDDLLCDGDASLSSVYSILIVKINSRYGVDYRFLYDVSRRRETAQALLNLLKENHVKPAEVEMLTEDLLGG